MKCDYNFNKWTNTEATRSQTVISLEEVKKNKLGSNEKIKLKS